MIFGETLKKLLVNSHNEVAEKLLKLKTDEADWISDIDYIDIAIDNPTKISFVTKDRYSRIINMSHRQEFKDLNKPLSLNKETYDRAKESWHGRNCQEMRDNKFFVRKDSICYNFNNTILSFSFIEPSWVIRPEYVKAFESKVHNIPNKDNIWNKEYRQKYAYMTSPGKFILKLNLDLSGKEVEEFNRLFFQEDIVLRVEGLHFELIRGKAIQKAYHYSSYYTEPDKDMGGTLNGSCMKHDNCQKIVKFYTKYPDEINLLVLKTEDDKIRGRAVVWKCLNNDTEITFMDRIYTDNCNFEEFFKSFAKREGWWYKAYQSYSEPKTFYVPDNNYVEYVNENIEITLPDVVGSPVPYLDTFATGETYNQDVTFHNSNSYDWDFHSTEGGPWNDNHENERWSERNQEWIPEDDAVYSSHYGDYIYESSAVWLEYKEDYVEDDDDDICCIDGDYYFKDDCVYSRYYNQWFREEDVVEIDNDYYKQDDCVYSDKLSEDLLMEEAVYSEYYESYIPSCDAVNINNDWILEEDLEEYKIEMGIKEYETTN
jgi:hypothetical protein